MENRTQTNGSRRRLDDDAGQLIIEKPERTQNAVEDSPSSMRATVGPDADVGGCTCPPRRRRRCCLPLFVVNAACLLLFWMMASPYTGGVVRTLERRFGLRSTQTGWIMSCSDIVHVCAVVFVGYFGRRSNKPRILAVTAMFAAVANLLMASPHWLVDPHDPWSSSSPPAGRAGSLDRYNGSMSTGSTQFCKKSDRLASGASSSNSSFSPDCLTRNHHQQQQSAAAAASSVHPAFYIFIAAQFLNGFGGSGIHALSLAYIDENASKTRSSIYVGAVTCMYAFAPLCGFTLSGFTLRFPEHLTSGASIARDHPSWIGCWWLGYIVCAVGIFVSALLMFSYPSSMKRNAERQTTHSPHKQIPSSRHDDGGGGDGDSSAVRNFLKMAKEFPRCLLHLLRNKPYIANLGCAVVTAYVIMGIYYNVVRYIEIHFHQPAFVASLISAFIVALTGAVGGFASGVIMSRLQLTLTGAVKLIMFGTCAFTLGIGLIVFIDCPQVMIAGHVDPITNRFTVRTDCNHQCDCRAFSWRSFQPVCGDDNITYFSPCFAGCSDVINGTYVGCRCISSSNFSASSSTGPDAGGSARPGQCLAPCQLIYLYAVILFVASLIGSLPSVPVTMVNFRVVDDDERSFALALNSFLMNLLGFIPAPLLFGWLIDSSCRLWQQTPTGCDGRSSGGGASTGSCLMFDTAKFRQRTYGVAFGFEVLEIVLIIVLYRLVRCRESRADTLKDAAADQLSPEVAGDRETNI